MIRRPAPTRRPSVEPTTPWEIGTEVELLVALAMSRASVRTLMKLTPHAANVMRDALAHEVEQLQDQSDPLSLAAASNVLEFLRDAA